MLERARRGVLRDRRGAPEAAPAGRLRLSDPRERPVAHHGDADEPQHRGLQRLHPLPRDGRDRPAADAGPRVLGARQRLLAERQLPDLRRRRARARPTCAATTGRPPYNARIVAVGGHLHGGAKDMWLSQPRCGDRRLLDTRPFFGMPDHLYYRVRPILHEPGPMDTHYFLSKTGIAIRKGEKIRLTGAYDAEHPHPRVMSIMHVYLARDPRPPQGLRGAARRHPLPPEVHERAARAAGGEGAAQRRQRPRPHVRDPRPAVARAAARGRRRRGPARQRSSPSPTSRCRSAPSSPGASSTARSTTSSSPTARASSAARRSRPGTSTRRASRSPAATRSSATCTR